MQKKARKTSESKTRKNNHQNSEKEMFYEKRKLCREVYSRLPICTEFEGFILIYEAMVAKREFDLLLFVE